MKPLAEALLYGILDMGYVPPADVERVTVALLEGGVDVLQLRAKEAGEEEFEALARRIIGLTEAAGVPLIFNDYPQLVPSVGAQGPMSGRMTFRWTMRDGGRAGHWRGRFSFH